MKVTVNGFLIQCKYSWRKEAEYIVVTHEWNDEDHATVMPYSFEVEIPESFNPIPVKVAALKIERTEVNKEFANKLMVIDTKINNLLAIENKP